MIVVEDEGKPPIARKRYDGARRKRWFFESAYGVGRAICENVIGMMYKHSMIWYS